MIKTQVNALTKKNRSFYEPLVDVVSRIDSRSQEESLNLAMSFFDSKFPITFNTIVCHLIYQYCVCQISCYDSYLNFLTLIKGAEEQIPNVNIIEMFCNLLLNINSKESDFLLEKMFEKGLINPNFVRYTKSLFFAHLMSPRTIRNLNDYDPYKDEYSGGVFWTDFFQNYQKLSENDWVLHKQLISEGNNPETITDIIKNDNVTKLREVSVVTNFDFDQKIKKSLYEKNSFINNDNVSLIDYAAFFGSIKCFNYLMSKDSNLKNTFKYAIAGGNLEILQSCYQNHSSPEGIFETAIEFHQNEIFHFFYEKEDINHDLSLSKLGTLCVRYSNYEIFSYLEKENMKIDDDIINEIATNGDLFLFNRFVEKRKLPKNVLFSAIKSGNVELVNYIIDKNEVDINEHLNNVLLNILIFYCLFYDSTYFSYKIWLL